MYDYLDQLEALATVAALVRDGDRAAHETLAHRRAESWAVGVVEPRRLAVTRRRSLASRRDYSARSQGRDSAGAWADQAARICYSSPARAVAPESDTRMSCRGDHQQRGARRRAAARIREKQVHERAPIRVEQRAREIAGEPGEPGHDHRWAGSGAGAARPRQAPPIRSASPAARSPARSGISDATDSAPATPAGRDGEQPPRDRARRPAPRHSRTTPLRDEPACLRPPQLAADRPRGAGASARDRATQRASQTTLGKRLLRTTTERLAHRPPDACSPRRAGAWSSPLLLETRSAGSETPAQERAWQPASSAGRPPRPTAGRHRSTSVSTSAATWDRRALGCRGSPCRSGDSRNNPCRRQGDRVVARPRRRAARWLRRQLTSGPTGRPGADVEPQHGAGGPSVPFSV